MASSSISIKVVATVGSVNLDCRSLYLHFECGVFFYRSRAVSQLKEDYLQMLSLSREITPRECLNVRWYVRLLRSIFKMFAPLL